MSIKTAFELTPSEWGEYRPFKSKMANANTGQREAEARKVAESIAHELLDRFGAIKVVLFGSLSRGDFNQWSDIDLAVWGVNSDQFYRAVAFASGYNSEWDVDLVDAEDCHEGLLKTIMRDGVAL